MDSAKRVLTDLRSYVDYLDEANLLIRVKSAIDFDYELAGMVKDDKWARLGIDATAPLPKDEKYGRATMQDVDLSNFDIDD